MQTSRSLISFKPFPKLPSVFSWKESKTFLWETSSSWSRLPSFAIDIGLKTPNKLFVARGSFSSYFVKKKEASRLTRKTPTSGDIQGVVSYPLYRAAVQNARIRQRDSLRQRQKKNGWRADATLLTWLCWRDFADVTFADVTFADVTAWPLKLVNRLPADRFLTSLFIYPWQKHRNFDKIDSAIWYPMQAQ